MKTETPFGTIYSETNRTLFAGSREQFNAALSYATKRKYFYSANAVARELPYQGFASLVVLVAGPDSSPRMSRWFAPADAARTVSDYEMPFCFRWGLDDDGDYCYLPEKGE